MGVKIKPPPTVQEEEQKAYSFALLDGLGGTITMNRFILLRKGKSLCALRLTSFRKETADSRTLFSTSKGPDPLGFAEYDWYFTRRVDGRFTGEGVESGQSELTFKPGLVVGIPFLNDKGHYIPRGNRTIKCGDLELPWYYPNRFQYKMNKRGWPVDVEKEHARTKWQDISRVDALHPDLIWTHYRDFDPADEPIVSNTWIPVEDLPPFDLDSPKTKDPPN